MFFSNVEFVTDPMCSGMFPEDYERSGADTMKFSTLVEITSAVHLSPRVASEVGEERGGLFYIAPPGHLKTTGIEVLDQYPKTRLISNITVKTLNALRQDFISGEIGTIGFPDYDMIYKRHSTVADQVEGTLMALAGEGFRNPAFSDQRISVLRARCTIVGGVTLKCYEERISAWLDNGFARRFLWSKYTLKNPEKLEEALTRWKRANIDGDFLLKMPANIIRHSLSEAQAKRVLWELRFQHDRKIPYILAQRIISVLLWKYPDRGWDIWNDFSPSLGKDGCHIVI